MAPLRKTAELLKTEVWLFIEGAAATANSSIGEVPRRLLPGLATRSRRIIRHDVEVYLTQIVQEKPETATREGRDEPLRGGSPTRADQGGDATPSSESAEVPAEPA